MKKIFLSSLALILFFLITPWIFQAKADHFDPLPTEFAYCEKDLSQIRSPYLITLERIDKWEAPLQNYFAEKKIGYSGQLRFYAYLYLAQRDTAFLSYNVHKCFIGSLDPITKLVVRTFFPNFTDFPADFYTDPYSEELAKHVWPPYLDRLEKERANPHTFKSCDDNPVSTKIQDIAKWIPWVSPLPDVPPPRLEAEMPNGEPLSDRQIYLMRAWAGEKGLKRHWRIVANDYMQRESIPLGKTLFARSILMMGLYDSQIAVLGAKYTYCIPRLQSPLIEMPTTPSYPSGHAAQAGTAAIVLTYFFPSASQEWNQLAQEGAQSRIWARVHTSEDVCEGMILGKKVGESILNTFRGTSSCAAEPSARCCPFSRK